MKKILISALMLFSITSFAKKISSSDVPLIVKKAFHKYFQAASKPSWELEKGNYEANFVQSGMKMSATFDSNGGWLETETEIGTNTLPSDANIYIEKNCKGKNIKKVSRIKMANGEEMYEAEVKGMDYIFDANGKFIKTEKD